MKKVIQWGLIAALVFYIVTQPANAAGVVRSIGGGLQSAAEGFGTFISNLV
jgi:hypothetical protein